MLVCSIVAICGSITTILFTPKYDSHHLEDENTYISLEHSCLLPAPEDIMAIRNKNKEYEMIQVVDSSCDYFMQEEDME